MFRPCALIGIYNHGDTISDVVAPLSSSTLPCRIVDDGSDVHTRRKLDDLASRFANVRVARLPENRGRGAALVHGFQWLEAEGFTHAVVLDADGQHDTKDVRAFVEAARREPDALILGRPVFGDDAPKSRLYGRRISQFWTWVATLSREIRDPLCGYRCYPLRATMTVLRETRIGHRMDFDPEIAVRLAWAGVPVVNLATHVRYPPGGISHYHLVADNVRIGWMHARLLFGMFRRLPRLISVRSGRRVGART